MGILDFLKDALIWLRCLIIRHDFYRLPINCRKHKQTQHNLYFCVWCGALGIPGFVVTGLRKNLKQMKENGEILENDEITNE